MSSASEGGQSIRGEYSDPTDEPANDAGERKAMPKPEDASESPENLTRVVSVGVDC